MENMDERLTEPKWVLMNWPKIPQMPQNWSAQIVCPSPKGILMQKKLHWTSVVNGGHNHIVTSTIKNALNLYFLPIWSNISSRPQPQWGKINSKYLFFQKMQCFFEISKTNIPKHYPELEIWKSCFLLWAENSNQISSSG